MIEGHQRQRLMVRDDSGGPSKILVANDDGGPLEMTTDGGRQWTTLDGGRWLLMSGVER